MEIAHVEVEPGRRARRFPWVTDNPLVHAVGRVPLPLGAKLIAGFAVIGALLAIGYVLGVVALGQSNSRGEELLRLQRQAVKLRLVLTDATLLQGAIEYRLNGPGSRKAFGSGLDQEIGNIMNQLCLDSGLRCLTNEQSIGSFRLSAVDPEAFRMLARSEPLFYPIIAAEAGPPGYVERHLTPANRFASSFATEVGGVARKTRARANALVAANNSSFASSRDILLGVGAGSLVLAVALGLLLSGSVVVPLRRTRTRLAAIASRDFSSRVVVPNRDEIGALAADVNRMSDELQRAYRELELASEHKSQFVTNMSHELRTPLNAIIGFSDVLHEQMFGGLNQRQLAYVNDIREAGKHQLSLINDLLDLAKIEAGRMELELSQVAIPELLRGAVSMQAERASRAGVKLALKTEPAEIMVTADERRVRQIVFNLLSNAVKFTPAEGRIDVSAHLENGHVEVAVADTGPGIAADELETIFEEFEQTDAGRRAEGTGLGLPLSRRLAELHGGRLWAQSQPGHGSTFHLTLPVGRTEPASVLPS
jgi:signal transduction histidine kinase